MSTESHQKINAAHLQQNAYLYVRQSSLRQVLENTESTKRQYALRQRAMALGWPSERIHVIDSDLGQSGAQSAGRDGFTRLVSEVAMGQVGVVMGLEVSRLARNNADWHRLLELSALTNTLILDEDGIYDPAHFNDRLLLGLKGTMSEAELHVLKARLQGGIRNKAQRGDLEVPLPIGLVYQLNKTVALDPDRQIQDSLRWVFDTFRDVGSAMAVVKRFRSEGLQFPRRLRRGIGKGDLLWGTLDHSRVLQLLHNPRYAGAYVYGRTRTARTATLQPTTLKVAQENWQVLIRDAHVGYLTWEAFERNQNTLRCNAGSFANGRRGSVPREGVGLLQGRVICGLCGERMRVRYQKVGGQQEPYYQCTEASVRRASKLCQSIRGKRIDEAISKLLLQRVAPAAIAAALSVHDEIAERIEHAETLRATRIERARYEAELARRRYVQVDPDNRLVADTLEADWNERLRELDALHQAHEHQRDHDKALLAEETRQRVMGLAQDFPAVWHSPRTTPVERKRMLALLVEDVTLTNRDEVTVQVRFRGAKTQTFTVPRPLPMSRVRKTPAAAVQAIDELLESYNDKQTAMQLNALGHRNWKGEIFTVKKVALVRLTYGLKSRHERLRERGFLTGAELAKRFDVSITTIHTWGRAGLLQRELYGNRARCLYAPRPSTVPVKGSGGRCPKAPTLVTVSPSEQEAV